ncbi:hypothetical protein [Streptomyces sp. CA-106110]|uniref:hypothetical protein n=1 Tax=Streptomyces sp. CA-106110 TaxID=3240044 RepID=UPI003D91C4D3
MNLSALPASTGRYETCPVCLTPDALWVEDISGMTYLDPLCDCAYTDVLEARDTADDNEGPLWREGSLSEADLAARLGVEYLKGRYVAWGRSRWSGWTGKVWKHCEEAQVYGAMRKAVTTLVNVETAEANRRLESAMTAASKMTDDDAAKAARAEATKQHAERMKMLRGLFWVNRIKTLLQGPGKSSTSTTECLTRTETC